MTFEEVKVELEPTLIKLQRKAYKASAKNLNEDSKLTLVVSTALKRILADPVKNPIMKINEAETYYFNPIDGLQHIQEKYMLIINLQSYITEKLYIPYIYDKYTILKIMQVTLTTYNEFISQCSTGVNARNEDIANLFVDIETMLFAERNSSAENRNKNSRAIDTVNRYSKAIGGYGATFEPIEKEDNNVIIMSVEESQKKLAEFGYSKMLENNDK